MNRGLRRKETAGADLWEGGVLLFREKKGFQVGLEGFQRGFCSERKRKDIPCRGAIKTEKSREPKVESLVRGIWRLRGSEAERRAREGV